MTGPAISLESVSKRFGDDWVLRDVDVVVESGLIVGLIGPSGSGKSTLVKLVTGIYGADEGRVEVLGVDPVRRRRRERTAIGYLPQQPVLFDDLSLWENMNFHAALNGVSMPRKARLRELFELVDLAGHESKLVRQASGGMQRRLALATTLVHRPSLVILDEPTAGIDPILRRRFWDYFRTLSDAGDTLVVSTQFVDEAAHCDVVVLLAEGRVIAAGTPDELVRRANGGALVDVNFTRRPLESDLNDLSTVDGVLAAEFHGADGIRLTLSETSSARAEVFEQIIRDDQIVGVSDVAPDWDDAFIKLVASARACGRSDVSNEGVSLDAESV